MAAPPDPYTLAGRVAVVTGAASGIGAATARAFAAAGADVALAWYPGDPHDVEPVRADVEAAGRRAVTVEADVRSGEDVEQLVEQCVAQLGRVDIAVANAGIAPRTPLEQLDDAAWDRVLDVNLSGAWRLFRAALPHMRAAGYGRLIAPSSEVGNVCAWEDHAHYAAAKAGLVGLVRNLAVQYGPDRITANAVAPGSVETPQALDAVNSLGPQALAASAALVPVRRVGQPDDIAHLYRYLASEASGFLTGQVIVIDGGLSLASAA
jgi:3-oxoacyl-[acyl-carrier protein] reductase